MKRQRLISTIMVLVLLLPSVLCGCSLKTGKYSGEENWAYYGIGEDKQADLFLIAPTVYGGDENHHNMDMSDEATRESFLGALNMERGIYEDTLRMYAPYYSQAAFNVYDMSEEEREKYAEVAYKDVREAFDYYMKYENDGRPFVLAGFSQGSEMLLKLMEDVFKDNEDYRNRMIAAYMIGWYMTEEDTAEYPYLKPAQGENDTGVIIIINSEAENITTSIAVPETTYGINPLSWNTSSEYAPKQMNEGACFTDYGGNIISEVKNLTGCYLDHVRGTLKITDVTSAEYPPVVNIFEDGVFHIYDYQFFYRNLQHNVANRVNAYFAE